MKIIRAKDYKDMSRKAANIISAQVIMKPNCVLGLATGGTPVGAYARQLPRGGSSYCVKIQMDKTSPFGRGGIAKQ